MPHQQSSTDRCVAAALEAFCRGDRLGSPWEGNEARWQPVDYANVLTRQREYPRGSDESDLVCCFATFAEQIDIAAPPELELLLADWAAYVAHHHGSTKYGRTWREFFATVRQLERGGCLDAARLQTLAAESGPKRRGSAGNGALVLALSAWNLARRLSLPAADVADALVRLSHAHLAARDSVTLLCGLFATLIDGAPLPTLPAGCAAVVELTDARRWLLPEAEFAKHFPYNALADVALAHALYALARFDDEPQLVATIVSLGGDADSVLAVTLMLHSLAQSAGHGRSFWLQLLETTTRGFPGQA